MGRTGPRLIPFLEEGLKLKKYRNLKYKNISKSVFSIYFPHKTKKLSSEDELIFKDWYALNEKKYLSSVNYTDAKQAMSSSLRRSDYVEKILANDNVLIYRILTAEEVIEKKKQKEICKKMKKESNYTDDPPSMDSAYSSGVDSPSDSGGDSPSDSGIDSPGGSGVDSSSDGVTNESSDAIMHAVEHDHAFGFVHQGKSPLRVHALLNNSVDPMFYSGPINAPTEEPMEMDYTTDNFIQPPILNAMTDDCIADYISVPEILNDDDLQKLGGIPTEDLIMENFSSSDGNIPSFDDIHPLDFDLSELFGTSQSNPDVHNSNEIAAGKNIYHCKKFEYLGKLLVLFCEAQINGMYEASNAGEMQIFFDEAVLKKIQGGKLLKCIFIKYDMLVLFEPKE